MGKTGEYITFNRIRFTLFTHSYAHFYISQYIKRKYKIENTFTLVELKKRYFNKRVIPEISKLCKVLQLNYLPLCKSILTSNLQIHYKDIREYAKHTLHHGTTPDKRGIIKALGGMIYIHNQLVCSAPSK